MNELMLGNILIKFVSKTKKKKKKNIYINLNLAHMDRLYPLETCSITSNLLQSVSVLTILIHILPFCTDLYVEFTIVFF